MYNKYGRHSTEKIIVLALIQTGDLWVSNGGFDNCTLTHHAANIFVVYIGNIQYKDAVYTLQ